nr:MAG TPA: hypothetical protein [Caudoviricetes sp.]
MTLAYMKIRSRFTTFYITIHITIILSSLWMGVLDEQTISCINPLW